jgi:hypothetical protein
MRENMYLSSKLSDIKLKWRSASAVQGFLIIKKVQYKGPEILSDEH